MSFVKREYVDQQTVITAENMNAIQDELLRLGVSEGSLWNSVTSAGTKASNALDNEAAAYNYHLQYHVGDYCLYQQKLYRCIVETPAAGEMWNSSHWTAVTVGDEMIETASDISVLRNTFETATGFSKVTGWNTGKRILTNTDPVSFTLESETDWACIVIDCSEGDVFTLTGKNTVSKCRLYCFCESDGTIVSRPTTNLDWTEQKFTTPANATKLVVNTITSVPYALYKGFILDEEINAIEDDIDAMKVKAIMTSFANSTEIIATEQNPVNINDIVDRGNYYISAGSAPFVTNLPETTAGRLTIMNLTATIRKFRIFQPIGSTAKIYVQSIADASLLTWGNWFRLSTKEYVDEFKKYVDDLFEFNSYPVKLYSNDVAETTVSGITYSISNGLISISGTATDNLSIVLEGSVSTIPAWVDNGRYYAQIIKAVPDNVKYQLMHYKAGSSSNAFVSCVSTQYFTVSDISTYDGVISRVRILKGETINNTIRVNILSAIPNCDIENHINSVKVRLMQYNAGKFNMGKTIDPETRDTYYLTSDNFESILNRYKGLLGDIQPDVIGIEEFEDSVLVKGVSGASDEIVSMDEVLFDRLYPHDTTTTELISKRSIKSKYPLNSSTKTRVYATYTWEETDYTISFWVVYSHISMGDKTFAVVVNAFPLSESGWTDERTLIVKEAAYQAVVDLLADDEYAFILCDANASEENQTIIMNDVLIPAGYNSAMGSYFPWHVTWESYTTGTQRCLDNIFYKGNIQLVNFKALWDEREYLASDHCPVYADFLIT